MTVFLTETVTVMATPTFFALFIYCQGHRLCLSMIYSSSDTAPFDRPGPGRRYSDMVHHRLILFIYWSSPLLFNKLLIVTLTVNRDHASLSPACLVLLSMHMRCLHALLTRPCPLHLRLHYIYLHAFVEPHHCVSQKHLL